MAITKEQLIEQKAQLEKEFAQLRDNLNATGGAIQILDKLIAQAEEPTSQPATDTSL